VDRKPRALIAGATGDLGTAVARVLDTQGWSLILHGNTRLTQLANLGDDLHAESVVNSDFEERDWEASVSNAIDREDSLEALVYCVGINPLAVTADEVAPSEWERVLHVNLTSAWRLITVCLPAMRKSQAASVVLVSSVFGVTAPARRLAYSVSKHGLIGLAQTVAQEEHGRVRANAVAAGPMWGENVRKIFQTHAREEGLTIDEYVATRARRIPARRFVTVEECAQVCAFLASNDSSGINGQTVTVDGGEF
jgi:NAD(P)-dependent dehydrogenase (short-subunit alcohol dehydrogenase family)